MTKIDFSQSNSIAIVLPQSPSFDFVASALSLQLSLESLGKRAAVSCPEPMTVEVNRLVGVNNITNNLGSRNLVITFPGQTDVVDKVSYNVDNGDLQLVVTPKENMQIDHTKLKIIPGGTAIDLAILVGTTDVPETLTNIKLVYFNSSLDPDASCLSETVAKMLQGQNLPINSDIATNLMLGITRATNGFTQAKVSKNTFDIASWLMENGARHQDEISANSFPAGSIPDPNWYEPKIYRGTTLT